MKKFRIIIAMLVLSAVCFADSTPIENLYSYKMKNGLSLFVAENHTVPLVYIEIAVRAGGIAQTPENAGLFHLYEHMMFKGNKKFKTAEDIQNALTQMGVSNWNGSTAPEYVNYYFTIPSDRLEDGLVFWNEAIRNPLMNVRELESEKQVVLSEITANQSDPSHYASYSYLKDFFPEAPWMSDPSGNPKVVQNATVSQLKAIQKKYYIPNNCALFVGGDVNPEQVKSLCDKIYGSWKKGKNPWQKSPARLNTEPFKNEANEPVFCVVPTPSVNENMVQVDVDFRGPDAAFDIPATYAADVLLSCVADPSGFFKQGLSQNKSLGIPSSEYCWCGYYTQRYLGVFKTGALMLYPTMNLSNRIDLFVEQIPLLLEQHIPDDSPLSQEQLSIVRQRILNDRIYEQETATGLLSTLRFWWTCIDENYYYTYADELSKIGRDEIQVFYDTYIRGKVPRVTLWVNEDLYNEVLAPELQKYRRITEDDAYWWN